MSIDMDLRRYDQISLPLLGQKPRPWELGAARSREERFYILLIAFYSHCRSSGSFCTIHRPWIQICPTPRWSIMKIASPTNRESLRTGMSHPSWLRFSFVDFRNSYLSHLRERVRYRVLVDRVLPGKKKNRTPRLSLPPTNTNQSSRNVTFAPRLSINGVVIFMIINPKR